MSTTILMKENFARSVKKQRTSTTRAIKRKTARSLIKTNRRMKENLKSMFPYIKRRKVNRNWIILIRINQIDRNGSRKIKNKRNHENIYECQVKRKLTLGKLSFLHQSTYCMSKKLTFIIVDLEQR